MVGHLPTSHAVGGVASKLPKIEGFSPRPAGGGRPKKNLAGESQSKGSWPPWPSLWWRRLATYRKCPPIQRLLRTDRVLPPRRDRSCVYKIGVSLLAQCPVHACGFKLANDGVDTRSLQAYLGHRNIQHTVRYTELAPTRFKNFWHD